MALFNFWGCFSESSESSRFVCNGDVCVLRDHNKVIDEKKKKKISLSKISGLKVELAQHRKDSEFLNSEADLGFKLNEFGL